MIFAIKLEKSVAGVGILGIVISKLCYRKKLCPIILLKVDKGSKVSFYYTILLFGLTVYLLVKGGKEFPLDAKKIA